MKKVNAPYGGVYSTVIEFDIPPTEAGTYLSPDALIRSINQRILAPTCPNSGRAY